MLEKYLPGEKYEVHFVIRKNSWLLEKLSSKHILEVNMGKKIFSSMVEIKKYVEINNINIIHCNSNNALFLSLLIRESANRKKIAVMHGDVLVDQGSKGAIIRHLYKKLENWLLKKGCCKCVAVSKSLKDILLNRGISEEKIEVIHNATEKIMYSSGPDYYENPIKICSIGYLLPPKNQILLLEALNYLKKSNCGVRFTCDIFGEGSERHSLEKYIKDNNLQEVRLMGFDPEVRSKLSQYALYVQPSKYESFGIAVIEAMYAGCYVIVNDIGGMREIVNEHIGSILQMTCCEKLADTIKELYYNRALIERKAQTGQQYASATFSTEKMMSGYRSLYQSVLGE